MKDSSFSRSGFTLIELMLVMAISLILVGGSLTAYLNFNQTQTVNNDARSLMTEINRVRTMASSLQYPEGCDSLENYNIVNDADLTGVIVTADCSPIDITSPVVKVLSGSVFKNLVNLTFTPGSGYLENGIDQQITINNIDDSNVSKMITVGVYGTVTSL